MCFLGTVLMATGAAIRVQCFREMGKHFTFSVTLLKDHKLITTGPYSYIRHPSYTGVFLNLMALVIWYTAEGSWVREREVYKMLLGWLILAPLITMISLLTLFLFQRISSEDEILRKTFGKEWDEWARKVPNRIIPGIYWWYTLTKHIAAQRQVSCGILGFLHFCSIWLALWMWCNYGGFEGFEDMSNNSIVQKGHIPMIAWPRFVFSSDQWTFNNSRLEKMSLAWCIRFCSIDFFRNLLTRRGGSASAVFMVLSLYRSAEHNQVKDLEVEDNSHRSRKGV